MSIIKMIPAKTAYIMVSTYMIILFCFGTSNLVLVLKDLLSGNSFKYNAEMKKRDDKSETLIKVSAN